MPEITGLREVSASNVLVELDGAPWRKISLNAAARAGLSVGKRLEREDLRLLGRELRRAEALNKATRMLARRPLSRALLEDRLQKKGVAPIAREEAIEVLEQARYLNDQSYALERAASLAERGYGDVAVHYTLEQERVDSELIELAVAALEPELERAWAMTTKIPDRKRLLGRLARRGFSAETIGILAEREIFD
ncbi:MAG TPA: RecX family transcriptional regulator [Gaiellaceae bacterium]|jgi:regulatory protein